MDQMNPRGRSLRLAVALVLAGLALSACGGSDKASSTTTPATTQSTTTSTKPVTTTTPSTTTAKTTTTTEAATTTTLCADGAKRTATSGQRQVCAAGQWTIETTIAPTTTSGPTLSREAKLAVTKCLDDLSVPTTLLADLVALDDMESTNTAEADCNDAVTQVDVDLDGSELAVSLSEIAYQVSRLKVLYVTGASLDAGGDAANTYTTVMIPLVAKAQQQYDAVK